MKTKKEDPSKEDLSELEKKFRENYPIVQAQIQEQIKTAQKFLAQAEKLADEHGIPFYSRISPLGQRYYPPSGEKLMDLGGDFREEFELYPQDDAWYGWEHSAVC